MTKKIIGNPTFMRERVHEKPIQRGENAKRGAGGARTIC